MQHIVRYSAIMEAVRKSWSDERLDYLNHRVDDGFRKVDERFEQVDERFDQVDKRFQQVDERFERFDTKLETLRSELNGRFDSLQRTLIQFNGLLIAAVLGLLATQL